MNKKEVAKLANGLYAIEWKDGSQSIAAVGRLSDGLVWIAPTNWGGKNGNLRNWSEHWKHVHIALPIL